MDFFRNQICNEFHSSLNIVLIKDGLELRFQGTGEKLADVESKLRGGLHLFNGSLFLLKESRSCGRTRLLHDLAESNRVVFHLREQRSRGQSQILLATRLVEVRDFAGQDKTIERPMENSIDSETVDTHGLYHCVAGSLTIPVIALERIEDDSLR